MKGFLRKYIRPIFLFICPKLYVSALLAYKKSGRNIKGFINLFKHNIFNLKLFKGKYIVVFEKLMKTISVDIDEEDYFFYSIDVDTYIIPKGVPVDNGSIDYSVFLDYSLEELIGQNEDRNKVLRCIIDYINSIEISLSNDDLKRNYQYIKDMISNKADSLEAALQRILFINQIIWQTGHRLNGLGRLDLILEKYDTKDVSDDKILILLKHFCKTLHKYYHYKSNQLNGDTGQLIILGGYGNDINMVQNRFTVLFLKAIAEVSLPDPKVLLRVSNKTDDNIWTNAMACLKAKTGSPLFSNDDVIIEKLVNFGYEKEDAINYTTSACWEPIPYDCLEQNNLRVINFLEPFDIISKELTKYSSMSQIYIRYYELLDLQISRICKFLSGVKFSYDPFLSLGINYCRNNDEDVSKGGGKYKNIGILSVGLSNAVNSMLRVEEAFENDTLIDLYNNIKNNFENKISAKKTFGMDDDNVLNITNSIIHHVEKELGKYTNYYGGKYKFGLSAPDYIIGARKIGASPDGRKCGSPMSVHISADGSVAPTELCCFASRLEYLNNAINGNVVDFFLSGAIVDEYEDKCIQLIRGAIDKGIYQMQMNLIDSKTLIAARENPELFPNLIVRVWGFSAYFNELPDEYKVYLIERAKSSEVAC